MTTVKKESKQQTFTKVIKGITFVKETNILRFNRLKKEDCKTITLR